MPSCSISGCRTNFVNDKMKKFLKFYRFPSLEKEPARRDIWIKAINKKYIDGVAWYPDESSMVCEKHFMNKFKSDDSDSPSYNPTLCLNEQTTVCNSMSKRHADDNFNDRPAKAARFCLEEEDSRDTPSEGDVAIVEDLALHSTHLPFIAVQSIHNSTNPQPEPRWGHSMNMVSREAVLVLGGQGGLGEVNKDYLWKLDLNQAKWADLSRRCNGIKPGARIGHIATYDPVIRCLYVYGGMRRNKWCPGLYILDVDNYRWTLLNDASFTNPITSSQEFNEESIVSITTTEATLTATAATITTSIGTTTTAAATTTTSETSTLTITSTNTILHLTSTSTTPSTSTTTTTTTFFSPTDETDVLPTTKTTTKTLVDSDKISKTEKPNIFDELYSSLSSSYSTNLSSTQLTSTISTLSNTISETLNTPPPSPPPTTTSFLSTTNTTTLASPFSTTTTTITSLAPQPTTTISQQSIPIPAKSDPAPPPDLLQLQKPSLNQPQTPQLKASNSPQKPSQLKSDLAKPQQQPSQLPSGLPKPPQQSPQQSPPSESTTTIVSSPPLLSYHSCVSYKHRLFIYGGTTPSQHREECNPHLYLFDCLDQVWKKPPVKGPLPPRRSGHSGSLVKNKMVVFGGWDAPVCFNDVHVLDMDTFTWCQPPISGPAPSPRSWHCSCVLSKNRVLIHGGFNGNSTLNDLFVLNIEFQQWTSLFLQPSLRIRAGHTSICLPYQHENGERDQVLMLAGGDNDDLFYNDLINVMVPIS